MAAKPSHWDEQVLAGIAASDDLHISPFRDDGTTYGTPTWIWSAVVDGDLYVRAYNGTNSRWYRSALNQRAGRIIAADHTVEVMFDTSDLPPAETIDNAYRAKYAGSAYLAPMVSARSQAATVRVTPALR